MALLFAKTHEWLNDLGDGVAAIGISDFAQNELGGLVFVNLPEPGDEVEVDVRGRRVPAKMVSATFYKRG